VLIGGSSGKQHSFADIFQRSSKNFSKLRTVLHIDFNKSSVYITLFVIIELGKTENIFIKSMHSKNFHYKR